MEFSAKKADLLRELNLTQGVVEKKTTIPILSNLLLECEGSVLRVSATDLELGFRCVCPAKIKKEGAGTVPAKRFLEIIRSLPDADVHLKILENHWVQVNCERTSFKLVGMAKDNFPALPLADSKTVQIGDPVHIIGFPGVVLSHELLNQSATVEASVTNGAISGFKQDKNNNPLIQTDAPAAWGNSGGPAVDEKGTVVGVLTFVSLAPGPEGSIVQGFNFMIASNAVKTFVAGTPVDLTASSKFNEIWFAGLRAFFGEDWKGAARRFEDAEKILPNQPDVKRMLGEARDKVKNPPPRPFPWFWVAIGVTFLSAGGYGTQFLIRWQKNRYRVGPSEVVKLIEEGKHPIILDTRKAASYEAMPIKIPGSVRLAPEELESGASGLELDTTRPVVAYCT